MRKLVNNSFFTKLIFLLNLILALFIPVIMWWSTTPTNVLNTMQGGKLLESTGIFGLSAMLFAGVPLGLAGRKWAYRLGSISKCARILATINLCIGVLEVVLLAILFIGVFSGNVTH